MKMHELKIWPDFYEAVLCGDKPFEVRRNDREFQKGDLVHLKPWSPKHCCYTEPYAGLVKRITYVSSSIGLLQDYVVLGLGEVSGGVRDE